MKLDKNKIFLLRAKQGLTVGALAEKAGVSRREISADKKIGAKSLGKIAKALGKEPEEIVVIEEDKV